MPYAFDAKKVESLLLREEKIGYALSLADHLRQESTEGGDKKVAGRIGDAPKNSALERPSNYLLMVLLE